MPSFLDLPGELRNEIYNQLLVIPAVHQPRPLGSDPPLYPQILSVCRQIHDEATPILYGDNTFIADPTRLTTHPTLRWKYKHISTPSTIALIKKYFLVVRLDGGVRFDKEAAAIKLDGAEELVVQASQADCSATDYGMLKLLEGVRGLKKCVIRGSIKACPEYVQWLERLMMTPKGTATEPFEMEREISLRQEKDVKVVARQQEVSIMRSMRIRI